MAESSLHYGVAHHLALDGVLHLSEQGAPAGLCLEWLVSECVLVVLQLQTSTNMSDERV